MKLVLGNKNYSSWSLRPWLLLSANNLSFEEVVIPLMKADTKEKISAYSQAGKVPVLQDGQITIWDSLAICEYVSETYLDGKGWPEATADRAEARAISAEMHSGFAAIRNHLPMNFRAEQRVIDISPDIQNEIDRIDYLWTSTRLKNQDSGPFLFGQFSIADCMYAPVASRFKTYGVNPSQPSKTYMDAILSHPSMLKWGQDCLAEQDVIPKSEVGQG